MPIYNYIDIIGDCFPGDEAYVSGAGDPTNYDDLIWITTPIPKATLEASNCAPFAEVGGGNPGSGVDGNGQSATLSATGRIVWGTIPARSGTTKLPDDDSVPSITEGTEIWGADFTPQSDQHAIKINFSATVDANKRRRVGLALFRDNVCIGSMIVNAFGSVRAEPISMLVMDLPNTSNSVRYSARIGGMESNCTWYVNRVKHARFGGTLEKQIFTLEELGE